MLVAPGETQMHLPFLHVRTCTHTHKHIYTHMHAHNALHAIHITRSRSAKLAQPRANAAGAASKTAANTLHAPHTVKRLGCKLWEEDSAQALCPDDGQDDAAGNHQQGYTHVDTPGGRGGEGRGCSNRGRGFRWTEDSA